MPALRLSEKRKYFSPDIHFDKAPSSLYIGVIVIRPLTKVFYDLDTKVESATGRGIEGKTDVCI